MTHAGEYDDFAFDAETFEKKKVELQGYLRSDNTYQHSESLNKKIASTGNEGNFRLDLEHEAVNIHADYSFFYRHVEYRGAEDESTLNALYQRFGDERQSLIVGKEVLRWGKGYAYNPVGFFEKIKNPVYPELSREGYWMANAQMTRTVDNSIVKNYTVTLLGIPDVKENEELFEQTDSRYGVKLYLLVEKTDIDLILADDAYGADFSSDIGYGIELHGEYAWKAGEESALIGTRYQSPTDLSLIAEYMKTFEATRLLYAKATQKEPFGIVYSGVYALYMRDVDSAFYRLQSGMTYDFKNGLVIECAVLKSDQGHGIKGIVQYYF